MEDLLIDHAFAIDDAFLQANDAAASHLLTDSVHQRLHSTSLALCNCC
jgi:hypothetical protein